MKTTKPSFDLFYDDAIAYLKWAIRGKREPAEILNTLIHDIGGIIREERCLVPKVSGWAKAMKSQGRRPK